MPARNTLRIDKEGAYYHIYNRGVERRTIFTDKKDYEAFLGFLKEYLTPLANPENIKKTFTIKGRTFRGIPHQPKNYFNKVELIAYSLMPNHFHLLAHQIIKGSIQKLIRSLCTRYSIYFNKKCGRTGSLFEGPYKSVQVKGVSRLLYLTHWLHHLPKGNGKDLSDSYSSYLEYSGARETSWVNPKVILSLFDQSENDSFKGVKGYRKFVEKYELDQKEKNLLEGIILESESEHLEGRKPILARRNLSKKPGFNPRLEVLSRIPELALATTVFALLFAFGIRNVSNSSAKTENPISFPISSPAPLVAGVQDVKPKIILEIKTEEASASVNIRARPTTQAEKIGKAKEGDAFEFVALDSGWYEVKLADGTTGFISAQYLEKIE